MPGNTRGQTRAKIIVLWEQFKVPTDVLVSTAYSGIVAFLKDRICLIIVHGAILGCSGSQCKG